MSTSGATAFLGVQVQSAAYADTSGVLVEGVVANGPIAQAGLTTGDVITAVDGTSVGDPTTLVNLLLTHHPGDSVMLSWTDQTGTPQTSTVTLGSGAPQKRGSPKQERLRLPCHVPGAPPPGD